MFGLFKNKKREKDILFSICKIVDQAQYGYTTKTAKENLLSYTNAYIQCEDIISQTRIKTSKHYTLFKLVYYDLFLHVNYIHDSIFKEDFKKNFCIQIKEKDPYVYFSTRLEFMIWVNENINTLPI